MGGHNQNALLYEAVKAVPEEGFSRVPAHAMSRRSSESLLILSDRLSNLSVDSVNPNAPTRISRCKLCCNESAYRGVALKARGGSEVNTSRLKISPPLESISSIGLMPRVYRIYLQSANRTVR